MKVSDVISPAIFSIPIDADFSLVPIKTLMHLRYDIYRKNSKVGVITLNRHDDFYSVKVINLDNSVRGLGLGSKVLIALSNKLGKITSSLDGQTSAPAKSMWENTAGVRKETVNNSNGFVYAIG